jgi:hypothetical protein
MRELTNNAHNTYRRLSRNLRLYSILGSKYHKLFREERNFHIGEDSIAWITQSLNNL